MKEIKDVQDEGVIRLWIAINGQAAKDYKKALSIVKELSAADWMDAMLEKHRKYLDGFCLEKQQEYLEKVREKRLIEAERTMRECENFFRSQLYSTITTIDGGVIIERLKQEMQNEL